jgi:hypothetical protein
MAGQLVSFAVVFLLAQSAVLGKDKFTNSDFCARILPQARSRSLQERRSLRRIVRRSGHCLASASEALKEREFHEKVIEPTMSVQDTRQHPRVNV